MSNATNNEKQVLQFGAGSVELRTDLTDYDRDFIPTVDENFHIDEAHFENLAVCVENDLNALLVGPTGCGKSEAIKFLAALVDQPLRRVNLHGDFRAADLIGEKVLEPDPETGSDRIVWRDGILPDAMRRGHWIILDEFDACPASIAMTVQAVLEPGHPLTLAANHGEVVKVHPNFRVFATGNTLGRGDESGLYTGTNMLNEATLDRFIVIECNYLEQELEEAVLMSKAGVSEPQARKFVEVARLVRQGLKDGEVFSTFSTRRLLAWSTLTMKFGGDEFAAAKAFKLTVANKLGSEDREFFSGVVQRVVGVEL